MISAHYNTCFFVRKQLPNLDKPAAKEAAQGTPQAGTKQLCNKLQFPNNKLQINLKLQCPPACWQIEMTKTRLRNEFDKVYVKDTVDLFVLTF